MGNKKTVFGFSLLFFMVVCALLGPWLTGYTYEETHLELKNLPPSRLFWFGSDDLGRDLCTRVCIGGRISLSIGIAAALLDLAFGIVYGGVAGLFGGKVDLMMMRLADIFYSLPYLLIAVLLLVILGPGIFSLLLSMTAVGWITMARVVRGQTLLIKNLEFVWAARLFGAGTWHLLRRHIFPNALTPILVTLTLTIPSAISTEAFLSFLGLGIQPPLSSWGTMVSEGLPALSYYPWRLFFPGLALSLTLFAFNLIGDGLTVFFNIRKQEV